MTSRMAVFASGGGTNLQAILDYHTARGTSRAGDVVLVASDRAGAGALDRARNAGIETAVLRSKSNAGGREPLHLLQQHRVDFLALAGYLKQVPSSVLLELPSRVVNVHPALLPAFGGPGMYGDRVHRAVLASGARVSGATVHYVEEEYDSGATLAQWPVPVMADDSPASLAARVLKVEHVLYPRVIDAVASGQWRFDARPRPVPEAAFRSLMNWDERQLVDEIDKAYGFNS
jgi:formyltetrahydrofolate-dependent phosphoribosylglycinamide formyltransferase